MVLTVNHLTELSEIPPTLTSGANVKFQKRGHRTSQSCLGLINELPSWEQTAPKAKN